MVELSNAALELAQNLKAHAARGELNVPMLPAVASRVIQITQDATSTADELAELIQSDQALAMHVMRIANSAAYSPNITLVSFQQAITRLGMNLISEIALAASVSGKMFKAAGFEKDIDHIWKHALGTALWSKEIAKSCKRDVEATFLCGLLHSIGTPVSLQLLCDINTESSITHDEILNLSQKFSRAMGKRVAIAWDMPEIVGEVIAFTNLWPEAPTAKDQTAAVSAGALLSRWQITQQISEEELLQSDALAFLNFYEDDIHALLEHSSIVHNTLEAMTV
ncbi:HDOD domain-containing protein [Marinibactrum halimedae]|uniref:HDOD domain-containing protein n=1 Tax=Marinibactrum halimedae TaxID=1444977 RepID=A0AA37T5M9_9GAMM|nr:HDOD domain-containing protein [Marinibactrum halimedae]MCD9459897.1 HDOD domain-containing protein [Marinibactrum halimedae]GLS25247.1 hypothetical protein GCM10007877_09610 [Marinibactrum halimedae]